MKKVLILYTASGYGHVKIAENIADALKGSFDVELANLFQVQEGWLERWGTAVYLWILQKAPWLWNFFYTNKSFIDLTLMFRTKVAAHNADQVKKLLEAGNYDWVISTQVAASSVMSYLKSENLFRGKLAVTFSDFHLHRYWLFDNVDLYLANIQEQKDQMIALGINPEKILVCGVTLKPAEQFDETSVREQFGVSFDDKIVLYLGGGRGLGIDYETVSELVELPAKVFVVCGQNEKLQNELLRNFAGNNNLEVLGYVNEMQKLYSIADVVVTKPGGLTVSECLQRRIPMLIVNYLPGQEKLNYDYLSEKSLVLPESISVKGVVEDELRNGSFKKSLDQNPEAAAIPQDGTSIRETLIQLTSEV